MLTDIDFYVNDYGGEAYALLGEKGLEKLLRRAERDIWCVCSDEACKAFEGREIGGNVAAIGIAEILKTAVCVQADFLAKNSEGAENEKNASNEEDRIGGNVTGASASGSVISSVKLGDFSVNYDYSSAAAESGGASENHGNELSVPINGCARGNVCGEALLILEKSGSLYRGSVRI
ncbi:MAG: hypothetical protein K2K57_01415 [Oscillospiraceae bacterium]|nr:hypothetical protein [Oscillospiraceae bacterium]